VRQWIGVWARAGREAYAHHVPLPRGGCTLLGPLSVMPGSLCRQGSFCVLWEAYPSRIRGYKTIRGSLAKCSTFGYHGFMVERTCEKCGEPFPIKPSRLGNGRGRFCSRDCRRAGELGPCPVCKRDFYVPRALLALGKGIYCGRECRDQDRRRALVECARDGCPKSFPRTYGAVPQRYCSHACRSASTPTQQVVCRCGRVKLLRASARPQEFCSWLCYNESRKTRQRRSCLICGQGYEVSSGRVAAGKGRFCSMRCYGLSKRKPRVELRCALKSCRKRFLVVPSRGESAKFHSHGCYLRSKVPVTFRCGACGSDFLSRPWRQPRYCSLSCSNRGRQRERRAEDVERNALIFDLHQKGLKAPVIRNHLADVRLDWDLAESSIRAILSRDLRPSSTDRGAHERSAALSAKL
jgi:hypothetical protein